MEENKEKIIYLKPTKYNTLEGDEDLEELEIKDFLKKIKKNLGNKKDLNTRVEADYMGFIVNIEDKKYRIKFNDIDSSFRKKLNKLCVELSQTKHEDDYEDNRPLKYIEKEVKILKLRVLGDSLMESLHILRTLPIPLALLIVFLTDFTTATDFAIVTIPCAFSFVDFLLASFGESNVFKNISRRYKSLKEDTRDLKVRKRELEKRDLISKLEELNKTYSNSINIGNKEEQIAKLLERLRKITSNEKYESIS